MVKHVVLMTFHGNVSDRDVAEMEKGLAGLPGRIPEIRGYHFGRDTRPERTYDFALVSDFNDTAAMKRYQSHPDHVMVVQMVRRLSATIAVVDFAY